MSAFIIELGKKEYDLGRFPIGYNDIKPFLGKAVTCYIQNTSNGNSYVREYIDCLTLEDIESFNDLGKYFKTRKYDNEEFLCICNYTTRSRAKYLIDNFDKIYLFFNGLGDGTFSDIDCYDREAKSIVGQDFYRTIESGEDILSAFMGLFRKGYKLRFFDFSQEVYIFERGFDMSIFKDSGYEWGVSIDPSNIRTLIKEPVNILDEYN